MLLAHRPVLDGRPAAPVVTPGHLDQPLHRVGAAAAAAHPGALLDQAGAGHPPALAGCADDVGGRDPHLVEEHLVEIGRAGHFAERADVDAGAAHVEDEAR